MDKFNKVYSKIIKEAASWSNIYYRDKNGKLKSVDGKERIGYSDGTVKETDTDACQKLAAECDEILLGLGFEKDDTSHNKSLLFDRYVNKISDEANLLIDIVKQREGSEEDALFDHLSCIYDDERYHEAGISLAKYKEDLLELVVESRKVLTHLLDQNYRYPEDLGHDMIEANKILAKVKTEVEAYYNRTKKSGKYVRRYK